MNLFYSSHIKGDYFELDEKESKHSVRVLRLRIGDRVVLVDGRGGWHVATIEDDHPKRCRLKIITHTYNYQPLSYELHMAVSPTKNQDRFEWFLEKSTEIGISEITPLMCHRTERKSINLERFDKILIAAMKQSLKAYKPTLNPPVALADFVNKEHKGSKGIAHCLAIQKRSITEMEQSDRYTLLVGPEGDFTDSEVQLALDANYLPFHLGESRLRTETAAVFICTAMKLLSL